MRSHGAEIEKMLEMGMQDLSQECACLLEVDPADLYHWDMSQQQQYWLQAMTAAQAANTRQARHEEDKRASSPMVQLIHPMERWRLGPENSGRLKHLTGEETQGKYPRGRLVNLITEDRWGGGGHCRFYMQYGVNAPIEVVRFFWRTVINQSTPIMNSISLVWLKHWE